MSGSDSSRIRALLKKLVVDQYRGLWEQYPIDPHPRESDQLKLLGLYALIAVILISNNYFGTTLFTALFEGTFAREEFRYGKMISWAWWITLMYIVPPYLYCRFVLGLRSRDLGLRLEGTLAHVPLYLAMLVIVLPVVVVVSGDAHFMKTYPLNRYAGNSWLWLGIWEISYAFQFVGVEFFFRGVMLFAAVRFVGPWALPIMVLPYVMIHFYKPWPESLAAIIAGVTLGIVALRTRSILAGIVLHTTVAWLMDALALWNKGAIHRLMEWK